MDAMEVLVNRVSRPMVTEPAPSEQQIALLLEAALRAPDHAGLRPYRFIRVQGERRNELGEALCRAALALDPSLSEGGQERLRKTLLRAPLLLLPVLVGQPHPKVPEVEQILSLGAAVSNILNAAHALGVGAMWRTGLVSYEPLVAEALGLADHEKLFGFIHLGTPAGKVKTREMVDPLSLLSEW